MKKTFLYFVFFLCGNLIFAQTISSKKWTDLFSYNNVLAMKEDNGRIIAATENGIFFYTPSTGEITKLSKANGLHDVKISAFDYDPVTKIGLVGYQSGTMDIITPDGITMIVDIPFATGYTGNKKINHIAINGNLAVISVGYGVSIFKLDKKEFGDSAFFISGGVYEPSKEAVIKDNMVYAVTNSGLKSHEINVSFPVYSTWQTVLAGNFSQISAKSVIAFSDANTVRFGTGTSFSTISKSFTNIKDVVVSAQNITVADDSSVFVYDLSGNFKKTFDAAEKINTSIISGDQIYTGTVNSGIFDENKQPYKPDGPYTNTSYKISLIDDQIWVSTGNRTNRYNDAFPDPRNLGFYYFTGTEWIYPSFFKNSNLSFNVMDVVGNPSDPKEVFFTNFIPSLSQGIYKMNYNPTRKDFDFVKFYSTGNEIYYNRPLGLAFDDKSNLFGTIAYLKNTSGLFAGIMAYNRTSDDFSYRSLQISNGVQKPLISENYIWVPLPRDNDIAVIDYKNTLNLSDDNITILKQSDGFAASASGTLSVAIDKSGDAWIGTDNGLRVLSSANSTFNNNPRVEPIIIEQNGLGEELFRDNSVLQIEVDSGNQKWVSIDGGGVFYLNADGQKTFEHFTKSNSPLPTNSVTDIKFDNKTGKVYFVTLDGIVVYQGDVVDVTSNFGNVLVYPNPVVYANYKGNVKIRGLAEKTNIRITDSAGNLVHQAVAKGGYYEWDLNNQRGKRVASGIYFVLMTNEDATDKATAKIAVVN